jgi:lysophospholipase L1-like esterase
MTNKTKEQLIYENWRKFLEEDLSEVSVYKYTGKAVDPDAPEALQVWDPETIKKTPTGKFALTGSDVEPLDTSALTGALGGIIDKAKEFAVDNAAPVGAGVAGYFGGKIAVNTALKALDNRRNRKNMLKVGKELSKQGIDPKKNPKAAKEVIKKITKRGIVSRLLGGPLKFIVRRAGPIALAYTAYEAYKYHENKKQTGSDQEEESILQKFKGFFGGDERAEKVAAMPHTADDEDALMRMLHAETSWARSLDEMAAIIQVAFNRKQSWRRKDFSSVVRPRTSGWNDGSSGYERNYNNADKFYNKSRAKKARDLVKRMLQGERPVGDLGGALNWLHAGKMPKCDAAHGTKIVRRTKKGKIRISYCFDYGTIGMPFGKRRVPTWAIQRGNKTGQLPGGRSKSKPELVGRMVYSNGSLKSTKPVDINASPSVRTTKDDQVSKDLPGIPTSKVDNPKKRVAVIGDSIMAGSYGAGGKLKNILEKENIRVDNLAVGGRTLVKVGRKQNDFISNQWEAVKRENKKSKFDFLVINGGTNDILGMGWTSSRNSKRNNQSLSQFNKIVKEATSMGMKVLVFPIMLPNRGRLSEPGPRINGKRTRTKLKSGHPRRYSKEQIQQESSLWNSKLKQIAAGSPNAYYVGGFEEFMMNPANTRDNLHGTSQANQEIAERLAEIIGSL